MERFNRFARASCGLRQEAGRLIPVASVWRDVRGPLFDVCKDLRGAMVMNSQLHRLFRAPVFHTRFRMNAEAYQRNDRSGGNGSATCPKNRQALGDLTLRAGWQACLCPKGRCIRRLWSVARSERLGAGGAGAQQGKGRWCEIEGDDGGQQNTARDGNRKGRPEAAALQDEGQKPAKGCNRCRDDMPA